MIIHIETTNISISNSSFSNI